MKRHIIIFVSFLIGLGSFSLAFLPENRLLGLLWEDGPVESAGALFFLFAGVMFLCCYSKSKGNGNQLGRIRTNRNVFFLFLGLLFVIAFSEEISWGQRIFQWKAEGFFQRNVQQETNVHNIDIFTNNLFSIYRLFILFWILYCLVLPLLHKYFPTLKKQLDKLNLPIPPLWVGGILAANLVMRKLFDSYGVIHSIGVRNKFQELVETNYAFCFFMLAWFWVTTRRFEIGQDHSPD